MKKAKHLLLVVLIIMCTACGNKEALSGDKVYERLNESFNILDIKDDYYDFSDYAYKITGKNNLSVIYVDTNKKLAQSIYVDETKNIFANVSKEILKEHNDSDYELKEDDIDKEITTGDNYSVVEINSPSKYYRIVWIDDTIMFGSVDKTSKTSLLDMMKGLGY